MRHIEDECYCACHNYKGAPTSFHVMPCCQDCPECGQRIKLSSVDRHAARHAAEEPRPEEAL